MRVTSLLLVVLCASATAGEPLAQRLGKPADAKLLIIHGDDLGMCRAANAAAEALLPQGVMNSGSAMVPCPWFPQLAAWAKRNPGHDLGVHLTLTSEWKHYRWGPVLGRGKVPTLIDADGFLHRSSGAVADAASARDVEAELRAQVARARALGLEPTHLDSHMGSVFGAPGHFAAYLKVARDTGVVAMVPRPNARQQKMLEDRGQLGLARMMLTMTEALGFPILDSLLSPAGRDLPARKAWLLKALAELPSGVHQLILHPAVGSDELRHITNSHRARDADYRLMKDPDVKAALARHEIELVTWRAIGAVWRAARQAK